MPEPTTETTQTTTTPGQGTVGATTTPAPSNTNTEQTQAPVTTPSGTGAPATTTAPQKLSPEEVQKRIDRMYARLQAEKQQRLAAEARLATSRPLVTQEPVDDGEVPPATTATPLTEADIEAVIERKERDKRIIFSETRVFERHPNALNEDGSYNLSDPFVQKYIEIGKGNPGLGLMDNGPELAEAMVDKALGIDYRKGRTDEAARIPNPANSFTTTSTTVPIPTNSVTTLTAVEQKVARRMNMTDKEYSDYRTKNQVQQKSWEVKVR